MDVTTNTAEREARIDRIVAAYADDLAADRDPRREAVLEENPDIADELARCFDMARAGAQDAMPADAALPPSRTLGDFRIVGELGRGGMGVVYEAEQLGVGRRVALKVLRNHLTLDERHVSRFRREAQAAGRLRHPSVVQVHTVGEVDGHHYIAMELVRGPSLAQVLVALRRSPHRPTAGDLAAATGREDLAREPGYAEAVIRLVLPVLAGVQAAHDAGLMHRDLKPSNILLDEHGAPKVADFGLARGHGDLGLSLTGEPLGTPHYMSPEQARAARDKVDGRTDVYSLGVTLYEMLTLELPFQGESVMEVIRKILAADPDRPRVRAADVPPDVEAVVLKAMHKDAASRYASPSEMAQDLERALRGVPVLAPRPTGVGAFLAAWRRATATGGLVFRSQATWLGMPVVHVAFGVDPETGRTRTARGVFAVGGRASGIVAVGGSANGVVAVGGMALGLVSFGGMAAGGLAFGGLACGLLALGGFAIGGVALGGFAIGYVASGGFALGVHVLNPGGGSAKALAVFRTLAPWWLDLLRIPR